MKNVFAEIAFNSGFEFTVIPNAINQRYPILDLKTHLANALINFAASEFFILYCIYTFQANGRV